MDFGGLYLTLFWNFKSFFFLFYFFLFFNVDYVLLVVCFWSNRESLSHPRARLAFFSCLYTDDTPINGHLLQNIVWFISRRIWLKFKAKSWGTDRGHGNYIFKKLFKFILYFFIRVSTNQSMLYQKSWQISCYYRSSSHNTTLVVYTCINM